MSTESSSAGSLKPHLLFDRGINPNLAAPLARLYQLRVVTLADVWGNDHALTMPDTEWITYCGANRLVAITANPKIWKVPAEAQAIIDSGARVIATKRTYARYELPIVIGRNISTILRTLRMAEATMVQISGAGPLTRIASNDASGS